jgi:hypothetical protein
VEGRSEMQVVSAEPLVFIGPGSEWFWTAVSGLVLGVTFLAIWRQLRVQASANAFAQVAGFDAELHSERLIWASHDIYSWLAAGKPPANLPDGAASAIGNHWESVGLLVRGGHLDRRVAYTSMSYAGQLDWAALAPSTAIIRTATGMNAIYEHFEWLARQMAAMDRARGEGVVFDEAYLVAQLPRQVEVCRDRLRIFDRLKVVHVRDASETEVPDSAMRGAVAPGGVVPESASQPPVA